MQSGPPRWVDAPTTFSCVRHLSGVLNVWVLEGTTVVGGSPGETSRNTSLRAGNSLETKRLSKGDRITKRKLTELPQKTSHFQNLKLFHWRFDSTLSPHPQSGHVTRSHPSPWAQPFLDLPSDLYCKTPLLLLTVTDVTSYLVITK